MSERLVAVLDGNIVQNVIVVAPDWDGADATHVEYTNGYPAGIGWEYDGTGFIPPKPCPSWVLNDYVWEAPVAMPDDGQSYVWDEASTSWQVVTDG